MRKTTTFFIFLAIIYTYMYCSVNASTTGNLIYEIIGNEKVCIIGCKTTATEITIPETIEGYPVTTISTEAFSFCSKLQSVTIPGSVVTMGSGVFLGCDKLKTAGPIGSGCNIEFGWSEFIPDSSFSDCESLISITIPDTITEIKRHAFYNCTQLDDITIHNNITQIGADAFYCSGYYNNYENWDNGVLYFDNYLLSAWPSLTGLYTIKNGTTCMAAGSFMNCINLSEIIIPESITCLDDMVFLGCTTLSAINIPNSVSRIGSATFGHCTSLKKLFIPNSVTKICPTSFSGCTNLSELEIGSGLKTIPDSAFAQCVGLTTVKIKTGVKKIESFAFYGCTNLSNIEIADSVISIGVYAFLDTAYYNNANNWKNDVLYIKNHLIDTKTTLSGLYNIEDGTVCIADKTFWGCSKLTTIVIPNTVKGIGLETFFYNYSYEYVNNIYYIGTIDEWSAVYIGTDSLRDYVTLSWYTYSVENNFVTITGADLKFGDIIIPKTLGGFPVTEIAQAAFLGNDIITSVVIPDGIKKIGSSAFLHCINLSFINISDSVTNIGQHAFYNTAYFNNINLWENGLLYIDNLLVSAKVDGSLKKDIVVKEGTLIIADYTFSETDIQSLTVPCSLTHIGNYAIYKCSSVVINYNDIYEEWLKVVIGDGNYAYRINHKLLGENAEYLVYEHYLDGINITGLSYNINENVEIPRIIQGKPVTHIGMNAFYDSNITDIFIPDSVTAIGDYAFYSCNYLESITIPNNVTHIGNCAFKFCSQIKNIVVPNSVTYIGKEAFHYCNQLNNITLSNNISTIEDYTFADCACLTGIIIPNSVTSIGKYAFSNCTQLKNIELSKNIIDIGGNAFELCSNLTRISLPWGVTTISIATFYNCTALVCISIPDSIKNIEQIAFFNCSNLKDVWYGGPSAKWNSVSIGSHNEPLKNASMHYNCCETHQYTIDCDDTCNLCGYMREISIDSIFTHMSSSEWIVEKPATCTAPGIQYKLCTICNTKCETENIPTIAHTYSSNWTTKQEATCQHEKIEYRECLHCSEKEYLYGEKTEHNYMLVASKDATISETGYVTYSCSWCELTYTDTIPVLEKLCCDVNCDGEIRINDLILLISHLNFSTALTEHGAYNADISGDGKIRMNDLIMLLNFLSSNEQI